MAATPTQLGTDKHQVSGKSSNLFDRNLRIETYRIVCMGGQDGASPRRKTDYMPYTLCRFPYNMLCLSVYTLLRHGITDQEVLSRI